MFDSAWAPANSGVPAWRGGFASAIWWSSAKPTACSRAKQPAEPAVGCPRTSRLDNGTRNLRVGHAPKGRVYVSWRTERGRSLVYAGCGSAPLHGHSPQGKRSGLTRKPQAPTGAHEKTPAQGPGCKSLSAVTHQGSRSGRKSGERRTARNKYTKSVYARQLTMRDPCDAHGCPLFMPASVRMPCRSPDGAQFSG